MTCTISTLENIDYQCMSITNVSDCFSEKKKNNDLNKLTMIINKNKKKFFFSRIMKYL